MVSPLVATNYASLLWDAASLKKLGTSPMSFYWFAATNKWVELG